MTRDEFAEAMTAGCWLIIPVGSMEAHGPHLPLGSDMIQAEHVARVVAQAVDGIVAGGIAYGLCGSTKNFPGTISLTFGTLEALAREILAEYVRHGARKILILSGHGGVAHLEALRQAALGVMERDQRVTILAVGPHDIHLPLPEGPPMPAADGHAGALETSVMLAIDSRLVRELQAAPRCQPEFPPGQLLRHPEQFFPAAVVGDPRAASRELGRQLIAAFATEVAKLLRRSPEEGA